MLDTMRYIVYMRGDRRERRERRGKGNEGRGLEKGGRLGEMRRKKKELGERVGN